MIHQTAIVSPEANIGSGVEIGPYAVVDAGVVVGNDSKISAHAVLKAGTRIGRSVTIESFCVIAGLPQDLSFDPNLETYSEIGDRSVVREGSTINRATREGKATSVGEDCFLMAVTHLGHDCRVGDRVVIGNNSLLAGFVSVGNYAFLGGASGIHQFCRIGAGVMFGGDSTATVDVPPFTMMAERNNLFGLNLVGLRRRGHKREAIKALKECYASLYSSQVNLKKSAAELLESRFGNVEECRVFLGFFMEGSRGFAQPRKRGREND